MPSNVKAYDRSEYSEDHLKNFQAAAKVERWAMPTWCHIFNSTLTGSASVWFDDLPPESVDSYDDLKRHSWKTSSNKRSALKTLVEVASSNQVQKKTLLAWKQQEAGRKQNFDRRGDLRNQ
ncbi:hypothetical protein Tco_0646548 [Tanacetum coccineum]